jgi:hypothetical protein
MKHHIISLAQPAALTRHPWLGSASNAIHGVLTVSLRSITCVSLSKSPKHRLVGQRTGIPFVGAALEPV